ncbi:MAG: type II toxin-antitoxin system HicA family toxin [Candidatus Rokubacteria bacterium]|nr:type II toxin-antitoxin system HicA family toxin [Candidatus Rokubacteria bacterium]
MPLPVVSGAKAVKAFERAGWVVARRKGSHIILKKPATFYTLSVPDHDELDPGTLRSLIRKAGLTVEEFAALLD